MIQTAGWLGVETVDHIGTPCIFCHKEMENVEIGPCPARWGQVMLDCGLQELKLCAAGEGFNLLPLEALAVLQELALLHYRIKALDSRNLHDQLANRAGTPSGGTDALQG